LAISFAQVRTYPPRKAADAMEVSPGFGTCGRVTPTDAGAREEGEDRLKIEGKGIVGVVRVRDGRGVGRRCQRAAPGDLARSEQGHARARILIQRGTSFALSGLL